MPKHYSIDQLAAITAQKANRLASGIFSDGARLKDKSIGGGISAPKIKTKRKWTNKTKTASPLAFIASASQSAGTLLSELLLGQRVR